MDEEIEKILLKGTEEDVLQYATLVVSEINLRKEFDKLCEKVETNEEIAK